MHHPFTHPARGNKNAVPVPSSKTPPAPDENKIRQQSRLPSPRRSIPSPRNAQDATLHIPQNPRQQKPQPPTERTPNRPAPRRSRPCTSKEKWNLQKSQIRIFLIGSKTIFDQKFFDLDLLSNKKQTKMTTRSAHQRNNIPVLKFFFYQNYKDD